MIEVAVLVRWALAHLVGAALADALPASVAAPAWTSAKGSCGDGNAGAVGTGAPRGSGVDRRNSWFPGCSCLDERICGCGDAGAVGTGAPSESGIDRRTSCFLCCFCLDKRKKQLW
jgi:hypothetical protein